MASPETVVFLILTLRSVGSQQILHLENLFAVGIILLHIAASDERILLLMRFMWKSFIIGFFF